MCSQQSKGAKYPQKSFNCADTFSLKITRFHAALKPIFRSLKPFQAFSSLLNLGARDFSFYMNTHNEYSFEDAASFMNMSEAYFSRYFKRMTGLTFSRYMNVLRVDRAIELLGQLEDITMADLMARCGFNTLRNFNRVFKEITGYPPKHLPANFSLNRRAFVNEETGFDPTLDTSIVLGE